MQPWDTYPNTYRLSDIERLQRTVQGGDCAQLIGLSGSGKSNLCGFLVDQCSDRPPKVLVDCNRLAGSDPAGLFNLIARKVGLEAQVTGLDGLIDHLDKHLTGPTDQLCLVFDRFEALQKNALELIPLAANLRALRDLYKYRLTYIFSTRIPLDPSTELAELIYANTFYLGPLSWEDARWSIRQFADRHNLNWNEPVCEKIAGLSGAYPGVLRAVCEAYASGCPLETAQLGQHPAVKRRLDEFWGEKPSPQVLALCGLADEERHALLYCNQSSPLEPGDLTAKEALLLAALQSRQGEICIKDDLIAAVWPEDQIYQQGLRDDSLAQLVRRLRQKIEINPGSPQHIQTVPGRGYRWME